MGRIYTYRMVYDCNNAPEVQGRKCYFYGCMKTIERMAGVGDWIAGFVGHGLAKSAEIAARKGKGVAVPRYALVYAMRVGKKQDAGMGRHILTAGKFYFFGQRAIDAEKVKLLQKLCPGYGMEYGRGHRVHEVSAVVAQFEQLLQKHGNGGRLGKHIQQHNYQSMGYATSYLKGMKRVRIVTNLSKADYTYTLVQQAHNEKNAHLISPGKLVTCDPAIKVFEVAQGGDIRILPQNFPK